MNAIAGLTQGFQLGTMFQEQRRIRTTRKAISAGFKSGGLMGASSAAIAAGMPELASAYETLAHNRRRMSMAESTHSMNRTLFDRQTAEYERTVANRKTIEAGYSKGGLRGAADAAASVGEIDAAAAFETLFQERGGYDTLLADKNQTEFGRNVMAIAPRAADVIQNLPALNRSLEQNPDLWRKALGLGEGRTPVRVYVAKNPRTGDTQMGVDVFNEESQSIGPATANATPGADDKVLTVKPEVFWRIANDWSMGNAATTRSKGGSGSNSELSNRYTGVQIDDRTRGVLDKATGEVTPLDTSSFETSAMIYEMAQDLADSQEGVMNVNQDQIGRNLSALIEIGMQAASLGINPGTVMGTANGYLTSPENPAFKLIHDGDGADDRDQGIMWIYDRLGLLTAPTESAGGKAAGQEGAAATAPADPGLSSIDEMPTGTNELLINHGPQELTDAINESLGNLPSDRDEISAEDAEMNRRIFGGDANVDPTGPGLALGEPGVDPTGQYGEGPGLAGIDSPGMEEWLAIGGGGRQVSPARIEEMPTSAEDAEMNRRIFGAGGDVDPTGQGTAPSPGEARLENRIDEAARQPGRNEVPSVADEMSRNMREIRSERAKQSTIQELIARITKSYEERGQAQGVRIEERIEATNELADRIIQEIGGGPAAPDVAGTGNPGAGLQSLMEDQIYYASGAERRGPSRLSKFRGAMEAGLEAIDSDVDRGREYIGEQAAAGFPLVRERWNEGLAAIGEDLGRARDAIGNELSYAAGEFGRTVADVLAGPNRATPADPPGGSGGLATAGMEAWREMGGGGRASGAPEASALQQVVAAVEDKLGGNYQSDAPARMAAEIYRQSPTMREIVESGDLSPELMADVIIQIMGRVSDGGS